jgi:hypothetical protein
LALAEQQAGICDEIAGDKAAALASYRGSAAKLEQLAGPQPGQCATLWLRVASLCSGKEKLAAMANANRWLVSLPQGAERAALAKSYEALR